MSPRSRVKEESQHLPVQLLCVCSSVLCSPVRWQSGRRILSPVKPHFMCFEMKPAAFVWSGSSSMGASDDINRRLGWGVQTPPPSLHSAQHSQESFIVPHILKGLRRAQIGTSSALFLSFCCISNRASRGWHLLSSCCLGMWCLLGKDSGSIWRFWRGLCPCSLYRGLRGVSYCEIRWRLSLANALMAAEWAQKHDRFTETAPQLLPVLTYSWSDFCGMPSRVRVIRVKLQTAVLTLLLHVVNLWSACVLCLAAEAGPEQL